MRRRDHHGGRREQFGQYCPVATVNPEGSVSVNAMPVSGIVFAAGLEIVKLRLSFRRAASPMRRRHWADGRWSNDGECSVDESESVVRRARDPTAAVIV